MREVKKKRHPGMECRHPRLEGRAPTVGALGDTD